jgi:hypothetical protein
MEHDPKFEASGSSQDILQGWRRPTLIAEAKTTMQKEKLRHTCRQRLVNLLEK